MKVYGLPMSTATRMVLATLAEKGQEAELVSVDLTKGEHKASPHVERHPFGVIPVLEDDDGFRLYESRAIIRYLDRKLPGASLTPSDVHAYARMEQFISVEHCYFSPAAMKVIWERLFKKFLGGARRTRRASRRAWRASSASSASSSRCWASSSTWRETASRSPR